MLTTPDTQNFATLLLAASRGHLALLEVRRRSDQKAVAAVCAVGLDGADYLFTPLALMVEVNPFEAFDPPDPEGGFVEEAES